MIFSNIFFPAVTNIFPIGISYMKEKKLSYLKITIWGLISLILNLFLFYIIMKEEKSNLLAILATSIISTVFNFGFEKEWIHPKNFFKLLLTFTLFMFSSIFQLIPIEILNLNPNNLTPNQENLLSLFSYSILLVIFFYMYKKDIIDNIKDFKKNKWKHLDVAFKYWFIGLMIMVGSNLLINLFATNAIAGNEQRVQSLISGSPIISLISIGISGPIIEELTFRKAFYDAFNNKKLFILMSGIVFGSLHIIGSYNSAWDLLFLIPYCSLGIAFAYTLTKTKNIFSTISMHIIHNTVLTAFSIIGSLVIMLW